MSIFNKLFKSKGPAVSEPAPSTAAASDHNKFDTLFARATAAAAKRELALAAQLYEEALQVDPTSAEAHYKRANALKDLGMLEDALQGYTAAIERKADYAYAYCNRGFVQHRLGLMEEALSSYDKAIAIDPTDALVHYNRALLLQDCSRWEEALTSYDGAVAANPDFADAQYNRGLALLYNGEYERGWRAFEWRWKNAARLSIGAVRGFEEPLWLGEEPLAGKRLLLHSEGGFGDTLQFCRYATSCAEQGATVFLEAQPQLLELLGSLKGVSQLIATGGALPQFDYHCPLMSLPLAFKTRLETVPAPPQYLQANKDKVARWRSILGERSVPRVGLVWSGNPNNWIDARRSIRLADWLEHLPPGFQYFRLQTEVAEEDEATLDSSSVIFTYDELLDSPDFAKTAALCECMDVIISVDTSVAHLCGALGKRIWLLLAFHPDWRWVRNRPDTPWYPNMRLYSQSSPGDWNGVFARVAADLRHEFGEGR